MIKRKLQRKAAPIGVVVLRRLRKIIAKVTSTSTQVAITCVSLVVHAAQPVVPVSNNQLPSGAVVASGQVSITSSSTANSANMQIIQTTPQAIINWNTFNVGANAKVNIQEPSAQSAILNRVGDANPTKIYGQITSNGQVFISNANGVYFSPTASVEVGGLVATTQAISDADFLSGKATFTRNDATGKVINKGTLKSSLGGYIALLAPEVINEGVVIAKMGSAVMASGDHITLNFNKAGSLLGVVTSESTIKTLIDNKNAVIAPGGLIILSAGAAQTLQSAVVKVSGSLIASSMKSEGGKIILQGSDIITTSTSKINANGATGGGSVSISGTQSVAIQPGTSINASSTSTGNGGAVSISAGSNLLVAGTITAQGGLVSGNGGHVQMTTNGSLALDSALVVNAGALSSSGLPGAWTVNAQALNINAAAAKAISTSLDTNHVNLNASQLYCDSSCSQSSVGQLKLAADALIQKTTGVDTSLHLYSDSVVDILGSVSNLSNNNLSLSITTPGQVLVGSKASVSATQITATATGIDILGMLFGTNNGSTGNGGTGDSGSANIPLINLFGVRVSVAGSIRSKSQNGGLSTIDIEGKEYIEITNTAAIDASSSLNGGNIRVVSSSGAVDVQGLIQTNGGSGRGGTIAVSGVVSTTFESASLNANGLQNGGKILIGNDSANGSLPFSAFTALNSSTSLSAIGLNSQKSSGGFIETSGRTLQMLAAINVGRGGMWLIDPTDLIIDDDPSDLNASVSASDISTALISSNVTLSTTGSGSCTNVTCTIPPGSGTTGNIILLSNISWSSRNSLTFNANGGLTGGGHLNATGSGAIYINQSGTSTYSGDISGSGSLNLGGTGTLILTGNNTYTGQTNINSGTLQIGDGTTNGSLGTGLVTVSANSTLNFNLATAASFTNGFNFTAAGSTIANLSPGTTASVTLSGGVNAGLNSLSVLNGGTAGITVSGSATPAAAGAGVFVEGNITFTGDSLNTLVITSVAPNTTITFASNVTPWFIGSATAANAPNIIVNSGVTAAEASSQGAGNLYYNNISGSGRLNLATGNASGYAYVLGTSTISNLSMAGAPLYFGNGGAVGQLTSGNVSASSGLFLNSTSPYNYSGNYSGSGGLTIQSGAITLSGVNSYTGNTTISSGGLVLSSSGVLGSGNYAGNVSIATGLSLQYASSATQKLSGVVSGAGSVVLTGSAGTLNLAGNNTYTGGTTVNAGTLQVSSATALGASTSAVSVASGAALDLNATVMTNTNALTLRGSGVGGAGAGAITNSASNSGTYAGAVSLAAASSIGGSNGNINITGIISGSNANALTKVGSNTLTLTGINTFLGGAVVGAGTLQLGLVNTLPSTGGVTISSGGALDLNGLMVTNSSTLTVNGSGVGGGGGGGGGAITNSSSTAASYSGPVTLASDSSFGGSSGNFTLSGVLSSANNLTKVGTNTISLSNTSNALSGNISITSGTLQLAGSGTFNGATYSGSISNSGTLQISSSANLTLSGLISGTGAITKDTATSNILTLSNTNTYSGNTTVSTGTLKFGNAQGLGTSTVTVSSGAMLDLNGFATQNNLNLSGSGNSNGALINTSASAASNSGNITLGANTSIYGSGDITLSGIISGTNSLTNASANNLYLTGQNTYTGATSVSAGNIILSSTGTLGGGSYSGAISIASGSSFQYLSTSNQTLSGVITGLGSLVVNSVGSTLTLSNGSNTFSGNTTVNGSTLSLSSAGNVTNTNISIINGGTLLATASFALPKGLAVGSVGNSLGGALAATSGNTLTESYVISGVGPLLINPGAQTGVVYLGNNNTYAGGTTVSSGWITFNSDSQFGAAGTTLTLNGGGIQTGVVGLSLSTSGTNRPIVIGSSGGSIASVQNIYGTASLTVPGTITASGAYTLNIGPLSGQNGTVALSNSVAIGSINLGYGTLNYSGASINTPGSTNTLTGSLSIASGTTFNFGATNTNTSYQQFNSITGSGVVNFNSGFVTLSGDQTFTGKYYFNGATATITGGSSGASSGLGTSSAIYITNGVVTLAGADNSFIGSSSTTPLYMYCLSSCSTTGGTLTTSGSYSYHLGPVNFLGLGTITSPASLTGDASTMGAYRFDGTISVLNYDTGYSGTATNTVAYISANKIQLSQSGGALINFNQQPWNFYYYSFNGCSCTYYETLNVSSAVIAPGGANNLTLQDTYNSQFNSYSYMNMTGNLNINKFYSNAPSVALSGTNTISSLYLMASETVVSTPSITNTTIYFQGGTLGYAVGNSNDYSPQFSQTNTSAINIDISNSLATYNTPITGTNTLNLYGGSGILTLNSVNTLSGVITVNSGTLKYGVQVALPITSTLNVNSYGVFDIAGFTVQLGALKFNGSYTTNAYIKDTVGTGSVSNTPITFANNSGNLLFSAAISGTSSVTEADLSSMTYYYSYPVGVSTLSGNNSYTGATTINSGTLALASNTAIPGTSTVTMNTRASVVYNLPTLNIGSSVDTIASLNAYEGLITGVTSGASPGMLSTTSQLSNAFNFASPNGYVVTVNAILGGTGGLTQTATASGPNTSGITVLNSNNVYSGGTYLLGGNLEITTPASSILRNSNITFNGGTLVGNTNTADLTLDTGYKLLFMTTGGFAATSASHSFILPNQLLLNSNSTPTTTVWYGSLGNNGSMTLPNVDPNNNSYTGTTEIGYGTLNMGASNALSTNSPIWLTNFGTYAMSTFNQNAISLQADSGSVTANTASPGQGVLTMPNTGTTTFFFDPANGVSINVQANLYSNGGGLTQTVPTGTVAGVDNYGVTYLTGKSTYTGQTYILGGNLSIISNSNIPSGSQINFNGGTLLANTNFTLSGYTLSFASGASGGFAATSGNTLTVGNVLTTTGNVTVWYRSRHCQFARGYG